MNSSKKESIAITAIINEANKYDNLEDNLRKRDKEPIWDGTLRLYKKDSNKKTDDVGEIPVQVKGKEAIIDKKEETLNYSVEIVDLESYKKSKKGAIFFVVEVFENRDTAIYYKMFDLESVNEILNSVKNGQKTKRVQFKRLKENELVSICIEFIKKLKIYEDIIPIKTVEVYDRKTICYDYNNKYELGELKKANEVFFETNAYKEAKEKLEKQNVIILHGEPWVGKTSTARKLVMNYIEQDYVFLYGNVDDLVDIKNKVSMEGKIIYLLDDFLGSNVRYLEKNVAESTLDKIINIFKNSKDKKLILTTRTYIYNNSKQLFYKFYHATGIKDEYLIDVANYNYMEKGCILYNHLKKNNVLGTLNYNQIIDEHFYEDIISHQNFNPGVIALICERMKDREIDNVKEYIKSVLNDPEKLWEEEYQKLNEYEKIILTIIVLFGVKVPEKYIKEQFNEIIKREKINHVDSEIFGKSIDILSISFIKSTFNEKDQRELEVCKHSVSDYIISKIRKGQIDIERYINSAKYVEVLHYINIILREDSSLREKLAQKVEKEFDTFKSFYYEKMDILYGILKRNINPKRAKLLENIISTAFFNYNTRLILSILENENDILYDYTIEMFKKYVVDENRYRFLYMLDYVSDCEEFFKACLITLGHQKNSNYMLDNFEIINEILINIVSEDIENTIEEIMMEYVAKDVLVGKSRNQIIREFIDGVVNDEIPSLRRLYSRDLYQEILETLYENCEVYIDEEDLQEEINKLKDNSEKEEFNYYHHLDVDPKQRKYIREKFEEGFVEENEEKDDIDLLRDMRGEMYRKWWLSCFVDSYFKKTNNIELYHEFVTQNKEIDHSLKGFGEQFLDYVLHQKNKVSNKAEKTLTEIAYTCFIKGNNCISESEMQEYEKREPQIIKELYNTKLLVKKERGTELLNEYIYLYIAVGEVIKRNDNLMEIIETWMKNDDSEYEDESFSNMEQKIFHLYSELDTVKFNSDYVIPALDAFTRIVEIKSRSSGKMGIARAIVGLTEVEVELDEKFDLYWIFSRIYRFSWALEFITGTEIRRNIGWFEYSIYKGVFEDKCYDKEEQVYRLDFKKILKDKELRDICKELGVWDYLYDIYSESIGVLDLLIENRKLNSYHIVSQKFEQKYFE